ncbi:MAG TPA: hypothetical protein VNF68_11725 [Candidatus Baltobacteraceae bacterium]|nr:hypothetical protein [Candidatus Baltobacteraceae bacterium]
MQPVTLTPPRSRALEFGIYRDGDNNLDASQSNALGQALQVSAEDSSIQFTVEDTTGLRAVDGDVVEGKTHTDQFTIAGGQIGDPQIGKTHEMSDPNNLAQFVKRTLDNAEASGAKQAWIELVDHGGGDGGGLMTHDGKLMSMPDIAKAIADGERMHAQEHPEDANRNIDGVVANQCLMSTMGFADALSRAGVKFLAASPETMISPGVPTTVAKDIAQHLDDPNGMAKSVVRDVMRTHYETPVGGIGPAAAFDVLDLNATKIKAAETAIKTFNDDASRDARASGIARDALRDDIAGVRGMVRFPEATPDMPWNADRPAMAVYNAVAADGSLDGTLRADARAASSAVDALVLAHKESAHFAPFDGSSYRDAVGPTIHAPVSHKQIDPWAPKVSETDNAFYKSVDQGNFVGAIA